MSQKSNTNSSTVEVLEDIMVAGLIINAENKFLLIKGQDGKLTFPVYQVKKLLGNTWEILEKNLTGSLKNNLKITIKSGMIPFTDQEFLGNDSFEKIIMFYVCRYHKGGTKLNWQKFSEFKRDEFAPLVYQVFAKAHDFIEKLSKLA